MKSTAVATVIGFTVVVLVAAGCGPKKTPQAQNTPSTSSSSSPSGSPSPTVKDLQVGNCSMYTKEEAIKLLGGVNLNNNKLNINTDGGKTIDICSHLYLVGLQSLSGVTYAVVKYDSGATAFAEAQKVRTEMLSDAAEHDWPVQSLTTPVPGAGPLLGGYGTKNEQGLTYTIAVVGTNVGPYLVAALGASTDSAENAKRYALTVFTALSVKAA
jgi:hypothetical protein